LREFNILQISRRDSMRPLTQMISQSNCCSTYSRHSQTAISLISVISLLIMKIAITIVWYRATIIVRLWIKKKAMNYLVSMEIHTTTWIYSNLHHLLCRMLILALNRRVSKSNNTSQEHRWVLDNLVLLIAFWRSELGRKVSLMRHPNQLLRYL